MLTNQFNKRIIDRLIEDNYLLYDKKQNKINVNQNIPPKYKHWVDKIITYMNMFLTQNKNFSIIDESKNVYNNPPFIMGIERMRQWAYFPNIILTYFGEIHQSEKERENTYGIQNGDITVDKYIENRINNNLIKNINNQDQKIITILCLELDDRIVYDPQSSINQTSVQNIFKNKYLNNKDVTLIYFNSFRNNPIYFDNEPTFQDLITETDKLIDLKNEGITDFTKKRWSFKNLIEDGYDIQDFSNLNLSGANISSNLNRNLMDTVTRDYSQTPYYKSLVEWSKKLTSHYIYGVIEFMQSIVTYYQNFNTIQNLGKVSVFTLKDLYNMGNKINLRNHTLVQDFNNFLTKYHILFAEFELFLNLSVYFVNPVLEVAYDIILIGGDNHVKDDNGLNNFLDNYMQNFIPPEFYDKYEQNIISKSQQTGNKNQRFMVKNKRVIPMKECRIFSKPQFDYDTFKTYMTNKLETKRISLKVFQYRTLFIDYPSHTDIDEIYRSETLTKSLTSDCFTNLGKEGREYTMNHLHQSRIFCLYEEEKLKAFCFMTKYYEIDNKESIFIHSLCSIVKGKKYCNKLLDRLVHLYKHYNLVLEVLKENKGAIKCYDKAGFSMMSETDIIYTLIIQGTGSLLGQSNLSLNSDIGYYYYDENNNFILL